MKNLNPTKNLIYITIFALAALVGCKKSGSVDPVLILDPAISNISLLTALPGTSVTITGNNFGTDITKDTVRFNGVAAQVSSANATSIVVTVPTTATSGKISIVTNGKTIIYPTDFVVLIPVPVISSVTMTTGANSAMISIVGSNFDPDLTKDVVTFGGSRAVIISASATQIVAQVYLIKATTGQVTVTAYGTTLTYATSFNISPYITSTFTSTAMGYLAADAAGNIYGVYGNIVVKVSAGGTASTLATVGASTSLLKGTAVDAAGNVYATGNTDRKIYKISPTGIVTTFAGSGTSGYVDGKGTAAQFIAPESLTIDPSGNLFVCDSARVRKIAPDGTVSTFAGSGTSGSVDGQGVSASFYSLISIAADKDGNVFVINTAGVIRKIAATGLVSTASLQGPLVANSIYNRPVFPQGIKGGTQLGVDPFGNLFVCNTLGIIFGTSNANAGISFPIYLIDKTGYVSEFWTADLVGYRGITSDNSGNIYVSQVSYGGLTPFVNKFTK